MRSFGRMKILRRKKSSLRISCFFVSNDFLSFLFHENYTEQAPGRSHKLRDFFYFIFNDFGAFGIREYSIVLAIRFLA